MANTIVVGAQWGDEGKGKLIDLFANDLVPNERYDIFVRFNGGNNAGHTLGDKEETKLHLVPSGILNRNKINVIGNGVVINLEVLVDEIEKLKNRGVHISPDNLRISNRAHVIMPWHIYLDGAKDKKSGIGTTGRGIGPAYTSKATRDGFRICDLFFTNDTEKNIEDAIKYFNSYFKFFGIKKRLHRNYINLYSGLTAHIAQYICDTSGFLNKSIDKGKKVLFEGAQGALLDIDHGTYPFVTSSNATAGGACTGSGVGPTRIRKVIGVTKAYTTRVGGGPFPTELFDKYGEHLQREGKEFGTTTGRKRRTGWPDLVALNYAKQVNGLTELAVMKLDVFNGLDEVQVCTGYRSGTAEIYHRYFPEQCDSLQNLKLVYNTFKGPFTDISNCRRHSALPSPYRRYINFIEDKLNLPVGTVSVGPKREQTIYR